MISTEMKFLLRGMLNVNEYKRYNINTVSKGIKLIYLKFKVFYIIKLLKSLESTIMY